MFIVGRVCCFHSAFAFRYRATWPGKARMSIGLVYWCARPWPLAPRKPVVAAGKRGVGDANSVTWLVKFETMPLRTAILKSEEGKVRVPVGPLMHCVARINCLTDVCKARRFRESF